MDDEFNDNDENETPEIKKINAEEEILIEDDFPPNAEPSKPFRVVSDVERLQLEIDALHRQVNALTQIISAVRALALIAVGVSGFVYFKTRDNNNHDQLTSSTESPTETREAPIAVISTEE